MDQPDAPMSCSRRRRRRALLDQNALALLVAERFGCSLTTFQTGPGAAWAVVRSAMRCLATVPTPSSNHPPLLQLCASVVFELPQEEGVAVRDCETSFGTGKNVTNATGPCVCRGCWVTRSRRLRKHPCGRAARPALPFGQHWISAVSGSTHQLLWLLP